jgi:hypothetical protein
MDRIEWGERAPGSAISILVWMSMAMLVLMSVGVGDSGIDRQQLVLLNRVMFV